MNDSRSTTEEGSINDDEHIYANVQEMEEESRRQGKPPIPSSADEPFRDVGSGWYEYLTDAGRSYFYNRETGDCHWKPPRFLKPPLEVISLVNGLSNEQNIPLHNEAESINDLSVSCPDPHPTISTAKPDDSISDENNKSGAVWTALSVRNKIAEKRMSIQTITQELQAAAAGHLHSYKSNEEIGIDINSLLVPKALGSEPCSSNYLNRLPSRNITQKSIKCGTLERCKVADAGIRLKKKEWTSCYLFLSSAHIIFYKDERSAEKSGRHYEAPLGMCDLRGATVMWANEKDKRRKHIFQLELTDGTTYYFSTANTQDVNGWFHAMRQVVSKLPRPDAYPTPVLERGLTTIGLMRNPSNLSYSSRSLSTGQTRRSFKKSKALGKGSDIAVASDEKKRADIEETRLTRESIIEKLKRFFRSRPSIESLKEKGIYKPEPVFGSTLAAICHHEQTIVPRFIQLVTEVVESKGLDTDGLYRVSGNLSSIQRIRCQVDQEKYVALLAEDDVHVLTGALKLFFRELSEPIFPVNLAKDFIYANRLPKGEGKLKAFDDLLNKLPLVNRETLKVLFGHLIRVANHADKNRMEIHNLAIMFGPSLFSSGTNEIHDDSKKRSNSKKGKVANKKSKEKPTGVQSNSHLAYNMIMQGQIVEYLLKEFKRFPSMQPQQQSSVYRS
ncbi:RhoGAP domain protein [Onchocerca flexuosa]|uniref:RhoGAP domain protein n=1 Tax=Onchocerca flexuosa TaxID=387005 RepID=A0A238BNK4_9BILA|nr:RhoGAP domain protein [Onchocerca flexuosa]